MHCPSCGLESSLDQKFCRQCGFNLEPVSKLITGDSDDLAAARREHERLLVGRMFRWISWGCLVLFVGVIMLVVNKSGVVYLPMLKLIATLITLLGVAIAGYGSLSSIAKATYLSPKTSKDPGQINQNNTTKELPEARIPVPMPSVTERTTQLISEEPQRRS